MQKQAGPALMLISLLALGWVKGSENPYSFCNVNVSSESVSADVKGAKNSSETRDKLMGEENYLREKILNMDKNLPVLEMNT